MADWEFFVGTFAYGKYYQIMNAGDEWILIIESRTALGEMVDCEVIEYRDEREAVSDILIWADSFGNTVFDCNLTVIDASVVKLKSLGVRSACLDMKLWDLEPQYQKKMLRRYMVDEAKDVDIANLPHQESM
tara:strand:- start:3712 stop:4107 length:396 start_codon:yes stop_codon:yes gene_type:complete